MECFHSDRFYFSHEVEGYIIHGNISIEMEMHNFMTGKDYVNNSKVFISQKGDNREHKDMIKMHRPETARDQIYGKPCVETPYDM